MRLNHVRRGSGEPLVLIHGIGDSIRLWEPVMGLLSRTFEVVAIDLPGFGRSPALPGTPTPAALAEAVRDFMGPAPFHVAGNSLGGGVALELGRTGAALSVCGLSPIGFARGPDRLWLDVSLRATRWVGARIPRRSLSLSLVRRLVTLQSSRRSIEAGPLEATIEDLALAPGYTPTRPHLVAYDFSGRPACPVTIAWGEHDYLLWPWQAGRAREALPEARHVTLTGCGHRPTIDDPVQVAEVIRSSATRSPPPPARAGA